MDVQKGFLLAVIALFLGIAARMLRPFLGYILITVIIAFVLYPLQRRISPFLGKKISAFILVILTLGLTIVPFALTVNAVIDDAQDLAGDLNGSETIKMDKFEQSIKDLTGRSIDIEAQLENVLRNFVSTTIGSVSTVLNVVTNIAIGVTLSVFLIFYLLVDGIRFKEWLKDITPLPKDLQDEMYAKTSKTTWAVVKGHIAVAAVQGSIAGLGLYLVGFQNYAFWTFVMVLLAFIPIVGAFIVWGPASILLFAQSRPSAGAFLLIWGAVVVGFTDNFLRPLLVDKNADLHPAVILLGVIGGMYVFGAAGILMGPIAFGVLKTVLEVFNERYHEL
ncbi:MAG: AI-2E family transporter [Candidatus Nanohalobium sp.]